MNTHTLVLMVRCPTRLPEALTGVALRSAEFTVRKDAPSTWSIHVPGTEAKIIELLEVIPNHVAHVDSLNLIPEKTTT